MLFSNFDPSRRNDSSSNPRAHYNEYPSNNEGQIVLNRLKNKLDPIERSAAPVNVLTLSVEDFNGLMEDFSALFNYYQNKKWLYEDRINVAWLYMALTLYVHHWAGDQNGNFLFEEQKITRVKELDQQFLPFLNQVLLSAEETINEQFDKRKINYHQKLLHIHANLFAMISLFRTNEKIGFDSLINQLPLHLSDDKLEISRKYASQRSTSVSFAERQINENLLQNLANVSQIFQPLKQNVEETFVERNTGLELDFPLLGKVSIETDGTHVGHFMQQGHHSLIHNLKAHALREQGWTRIGLVPQNGSQQISNLVGLMQITEVTQYAEQYSQLIDLSHKIREEIVKTNRQLRNRGISEDSRELKKRYIQSLIEMEDSIRVIISRRDLETMLRVAGSSNIAESLNKYNQYRRLQSLANQSKAKLDEEIVSKEQLEAKASARSDKKNEISNEIEKNREIISKERERQQRARQRIAAGNLSSENIKKEEKFIKELESSCRNKELQEDKLTIQMQAMDDEVANALHGIILQEKNISHLEKSYEELIRKASAYKDGHDYLDSKVRRYLSCNELEKLFEEKRKAFDETVASYLQADDNLRSQEEISREELRQRQRQQRRASVNPYPSYSYRREDKYSSSSHYSSYSHRREDKYSSERHDNYYSGGRSGYKR